MWHSYNPLIWPWDVCHVEGQQRLDMTIGRPPHGKPHPSDMVVECVTCGKRDELHLPATYKVCFFQHYIIEEGPTVLNHALVSW